MGTGEGQRRRIFLSSTEVDLRAERAVAALALERFGFDVERMEEFGSGAPASWESCRRAVERCDALLLLIGTEYGTPVPGSGGLSFTESEYETARAIGIPVFVLVDETFASGADGDPRLRTFHARLRDAHTIARRSFRIGDYESVREAVERTFEGVEISAAGPKTARVAHARLGRPFFNRADRKAIDSEMYAIGAVRRALLELHPYRVFLAYLRVAGQQEFPYRTPDRLLLKGVELRDSLDARGVSVRFVNEIRVRALNDEQRLAARVAKLRPRSSLTVCIVHDELDYPSVTQFENGKGLLAVVIPETLQIPQEDRPGEHWIEYAEAEVESCGVTTKTIAYVDDCLDDHLIEVF